MQHAAFYALNVNCVLGRAVKLRTSFLPSAALVHSTTRRDLNSHHYTYKKRRGQATNIIKHMVSNKRSAAQNKDKPSSRIYPRKIKD